MRNVSVSNKTFELPSEYISERSRFDRLHLTVVAFFAVVLTRLIFYSCGLLMLHSQNRIESSSEEVDSDRREDGGEFTGEYNDCVSIVVLLRCVSAVCVTETSAPR